MKHKKLIALLLAGSMAVSMLAGCGSDKEESSQASSSAESSTSAASSDSAASESSDSGEFDPRSITEGVTLTIAITENARVEDYNTNETTLAIEEALGVNLEFITYPAADFFEKINVMIMSGDELPDMIFKGGSSSTDWSSWIAEGALLPLTDYYSDPNLASNIIAFSEESGIDVAGSLTMADGEIYYLPTYGHSPNGEVFGRLWYYEPWLEEIGMDVPTTIDEFYEVCKVITETDLNGNGKKDEIALGGDGLGSGQTDYWFNCLMCAFVYAWDKEYRIIEDGVVNYAYNTEAWREGLRYIKKFFDDGIIPKETLTQSKNQWYAQICADEQTVWCFGDWEPYNTTNKPYEWVVDNDCLMPLAGPDGTAYAMYRPGMPGLGGAITIDCENPEAAFLVANMFCSEELSITKRFGQRGVDWDYWDEAKIEDKESYAAYDPSKEIYIICYNDGEFWSGTEIQNRSYMGYAPGLYGDKVFSGRATKVKGLTEDEQYVLDAQNEVIAAYNALHEYVPEQVFDYAPLTTEETEQIAEIKSSIKSYMLEMTGAFLAGNKDLDADWDSYLAELKKIGIDEIIEVYQTAYDRVH